MGHYPDNWYISSNQVYNVFKGLRDMCRLHGKFLNAGGAQHMLEYIDAYLEEHSIEIDEKNSQISMEK